MKMFADLSRGGAGALNHARYFLALLSIVSGAVPVAAQESDGRIGAGAGVVGLGLFDDVGRAKVSSGLTGWLDFTPTPGVSLESRVSWFPGRESPDYGSQGGRTLTAHGGLRGTLFETRHLHLQGILHSGVVRFSHTAKGHDDGTVTFGSKTQYSMAMGFGLEMGRASRWAPRVDFVRTLFVVPGTTLYRGPEQGGAVASAEVPGRIIDTFQVTAGVRYRPTMRPERPRGPDGRRFTAGAHVVHSVATRWAQLSPHHDGGFGGFVSYRLAGPVYLDGALTTFLRESKVRTPWEGGRVLQGTAGLKAGARRGPVGLFVKLRGGVNRHTEAFKERVWRPYTLTLSRSTVSVLDVGGIVEVNRGARTFFRLEGGSLTSFYGNRTLLLDGVPVPQGRAESTQTLQTSVGIGWRF